MDNADFCPFCMSELKEKIPVTAKAKQTPYKKVIVGCVALCLAVIIVFIAFGNINTKNGNIKSPTGSNVSDGNVTSKPNNSETENNQTEDSGSSPSPNQGGNTKPQNQSGGGNVSNGGTDNDEVTGNTDNNDNNTNNDNSGNNGGSGNETENKNQTNNTQSGGNTGGSGSDGNDNNSSSTTAPPVVNDEVVKYLTYEFKIDEDTNETFALITDCDTSIAGEVVIPTKIDGKNVRSIEYNAFKDCKKITSVIIGEAVTMIKDNAFENCTSLKKVVIKDNGISLGSETFKNCTSLSEVDLPEISNIPEGCFEGCTSLENIETTAHEISRNAFKDCIKLKTITIKSFIHPFVRENAFVGCTSLDNVYCNYDISKMSISNGNDYFKNATFHKI